MVPVSRPASAASRRLSPLGPVASLCTVGAQHVLLELGRDSVEVPQRGGIRETRQQRSRGLGSPGAQWLTG